VGGASTTSLSAAHFALRNTKFGGGGKIGIRQRRTGSKRGRAKIPCLLVGRLPPNPPPFCPPERSVSAARSAAISRSFVQNGFELRSVIAIVIYLKDLGFKNN